MVCGTARPREGVMARRRSSEQVQSMGKTLRRIAGEHRTGWRAAAIILSRIVLRANSFVAAFAAAVVLCLSPLSAQNAPDIIAGAGVRVDSGRFTVVGD